MRTARVGVLSGLAALVLLAAAWLVGPARAEDDEALKRQALALNEVTGEDPIKGEVKALVQKPEATKKLLAVAVRMAKEKDQPFNYNGAYILAQTAHVLKDLDAGRIFYRICIDQSVKLISGQKLAQAYSGLIDLLTQHHKNEECIKVCQEFLDLPDEGAVMNPVKRLQGLVLSRLALILARDGQIEKANKLVDALLEARPDSLAALDLKAQVQREAGKVADSAKTYEDLLGRVQKDKNYTDEEKTGYIEEIRYKLSNVYVDLNKIDKAAEHLKALLAKKPDDPTYNNDLGYIWADHDMNLDEAEKMIRKALEEDRKQRKAIADLPAEEDRDNAAYLDSMGWVLFKKKQYAEAKKYLLLAVKEKEGQHIEILDHLGDVHLALNEKAEAIAAWKKAVAVEPQSKREKEKKAEVEKKIAAQSK
jgi:tetratricopeptide (TPR) repeat protein